MAAHYTDLMIVHQPSIPRVKFGTVGLNLTRQPTLVDTV